MKCYDIFMQTMLGEKKGKLTAAIENGRLQGLLSLLGHTQPISGQVNEKGECSLSGAFTTLMNTVYFTATGFITPEGIRLTLKNGDQIYEMSGIPQKEADRHA